MTRKTLLVVDEFAANKSLDEFSGQKCPYERIATTAELELAHCAVGAALEKVKASGEQVAAVLVRWERESQPTGPQLIKQLSAANRSVPVIAIARQRDHANAKRACDLGAFEYRVLPGNKLDPFLRILHVGTVVRGPGTRFDKLQRIVMGQSPKLLKQLKEVETILDHPDVNVLITGERGTGKDQLVHAIHYLGLREGGPLETVDLTAFQPEIIESELFGHERGAYTGAFEQFEGAFERCRKGTAFINEIGDVTDALQGKLRRALEDRVFSRKLGKAEITLDARIICATNRDLFRLGREGLFKQDLLDRMKGVVITLPPLRERQEDVPLLVRHFLGDGYGVTQEALQRLNGLPYPGNVRELRGLIEQARRRCQSRGATQIERRDLDDEGADREPATPGDLVTFSISAEKLKGKLPPLEDELLEQLWRRYFGELISQGRSMGDIDAAAGITHKTRIEKMTRCHLIEPKGGSEGQKESPK
jgi:DNA-binding NtrC family response regulator